MNFKRVTVLALFVIFFIYTNETIAQCAMCKANAESNIKDGGTIAKGLNTGILYLMAIPYLILGTLFFLFFKKQIVEKINILKSRFRSV